MALNDFSRGVDEPKPEGHVEIQRHRLVSSSTASELKRPPQPVDGGRLPRYPGSVMALQTMVGNNAVSLWLAPTSTSHSHVQRFGSKEHVALGDAASKEHVGIRYTEDWKDTLSFGETVAMSGDYFGSPGIMQMLSMNPDGREELACARAKVLGIAPPNVSPAAKKAVDNRYFQLAAKNRSHFSAGGSAQISYESGHMLALQEAYKSGQQGDNSYFTQALFLEASCDHYLTDLFSGGHVRTPRTEIQDYYQAKYGQSVVAMKEWLTSYLVRRLNALNPVELANVPNSLVASTVNDMLSDLAGAALDSFSLGGLVSMAMHDFDNVKGVPVVSGCGPDEKPVPGGFFWTAMGDDQIGSGGGAGNAATTFSMASAATKVSRTELDFAYSLGMKDASKVIHPFDLDAAALGAVSTMQPVRALAFIPQEDKRSRTGEAADMSDGPLGDWRWGKFSPAMRAAFESSVRAQVVSKVNDAAKDVPEPKEIMLGMKQIHARQAVTDLAGQLDRAPLTTFEALFGPA